MVSLITYHLIELDKRGLNRIIKCIRMRFMMKILSSLKKEQSLNNHWKQGSKVG
jgi:hypothetical protein